ncbi:TonB-dependent receptor [Methylomonas sp. DH-1]|uniref:TonB-dependent siderophore receptor n=1 Tax=Methylomonas sp. (strain DH-1) TaxID=1727196 RepID=UPI0007C8FC09|nr:TonB-dependent receptor [Methylomonas sp. DH-1]ANE57522.1 TonB-dependent receptor [Methylomonas sp. DH-1]
MLASYHLFGVGAVSAADPSVRHYRIPSQSLNNALLRFATESNLELVFSADGVRGIDSPNLDGDFTPEQALGKLLQGSGFSYRFNDADTVTLELQPQTTDQALPSRPVTLEALTVIGETGSKMPAATDPTTETLVETGVPRYAVATIASATRTDTPTRQIPQSVQTVKRSLIDDQQSVTVSESLINVSGVVPRNTLYTPALEGTIIRGFASEQLLDGFTQYYNPGDRESTANIDQVEVLKGSNALLYSGGSGSPVGGVVNISSKLPQAKVFAEAGVKVGSYDFYQPFIDLNQPLNDNVLFRINAEYTAAGNRIDAIDSQRFNANPALTFTDNDRTRFTVQGKISRWQQPEYQGAPATGTIAGDFRSDSDRFIGPANAPDSRSKTDAVWGTLEHRLNAIWTLTLKARYAESAFNQRVQTLFGDDNFSADRPYSLFGSTTWALVNAELSQHQQERSVQGYAVAKFDLGPSKHSLVLGADGSRLDDAGFIDADMARTGLADLSAPVFNLPYHKPGPGIDNQFIGNLTYGGYAQLQSDFYRRFHLLGGLRLGTVEIGFENRQLHIRATTDSQKLLPKVGGVVDLTDHISWFAGYSEGVRGQPFVNFVSTPLPELSRHLETGCKFQVADQLSGQVAVYRIDRSQVAVTDSGDIERRSVAAGQQRSRGIEADLAWQPFQALSVLANYAHTDARFADGKAGVAAGNRLPQVPENSGRVWSHYRFQAGILNGWSAGFGVYLRDGAFLSNNNGFKTSGYHSFDAAIAYETGHFKLAATVKNLTGERYFLPYDYFDGRVAPAANTSLFATLSVKY